MKITWDAFKDVVDMISKIFLPLAVLFVGQAYTNQQAKSAQERADFDKITSIIDRLDSEKPKEEERALLELVYFVNQCRFSMVIIPALQESAKESDPAVAQQAARVLNTAVGSCSDARTLTQTAGKSNSDLAAALANVAQTVPSIAKVIDFEKLPATVFIHIKSEAQREQGEEAKQALQANGYGVSAIRIVSTEPSDRELRYFHQNAQEAREADSAASILGIANIGQVHPKAMANFEGKMPPRRYELWLPN